MARILILENNPPDQEVLEQCLQTMGHDAVAVSKIAAVLELMNDTTFDLVLSGLHLEEGSAFELLKKMKSSERYDNVPIVFVSMKRTPISVVIDGTLTQVLTALGADAVLSMHSVNPARLEEAIDNALKKH